MNSPCYDCPNRKPLCHASCVSYKDWLEKRNELKGIDQRRREYENMSWKGRWKRK